MSTSKTPTPRRTLSLAWFFYGASVLCILFIVYLIVDWTMLWNYAVCQYSTCHVVSDVWYPHAGYVYINVTSPVIFQIKEYFSSSQSEFLTCATFYNLEPIRGENAIGCWVRWGEALTALSFKQGSFPLWHMLGVLLSIVGVIVFFGMGTEAVKESVNTQYALAEMPGKGLVASPSTEHLDPDFPSQSV